MSHLCRILAHCDLTHLSLEENPLGDMGAMQFAEVIKHTRLKELELCKCEIRDNGCRALAKSLAENHQQSLTYLGLAGDMTKADSQLALVGALGTGKAVFFHL